MNKSLQLLALGLGATAASALHAQTTLYRETFGFNTASPAANASTSITGWSVWRATTVGGNAIDSSANAAQAQITNGTGDTASVTSVNSGSPLSGTTGFLQSYGSYEGLVFTNEYVIDRSAFELDSVSFRANRSTGTVGVVSANFAVQIGGSWYVTTPPGASNLTTGNNNTNATSFSTSQLISFDLSAVTWRTLSAGVGQAFSVGSSSVSLPTLGNITAFGIYYNLGTSASPITSRYDTFTITGTAIPEPSAFAALAGLGALGLAGTRRRRR